jgi:hypothetical protein
MRNFDYLRERLEGAAGIAHRKFHGLSHADLMARIHDDFPQMMDDRLAMGELRYGKTKTSVAKFRDFKKAGERMALYMATGNTEHLIDAANFLRLEFKRSKHPKRHFKSSDRE